MSSQKPKKHQRKRSATKDPTARRIHTQGTRDFKNMKSPVWKNASLALLPTFKSDFFFCSKWPTDT